MDEDCDLTEVAKQCPLVFTGADFYALSSDAMLKAMARAIESCRNKLRQWNDSGPHFNHPHPTSSIYFLEHICDKNEIKPTVGMQDFLGALKELKPSVNSQELQKYEYLRTKFNPSINK